MKKVWMAASIALAVAACGPAIELKDRPLFKNGNNSVTFMVYDGFTGAPITNATIKLLIGSYSLDAVQTEQTNSYTVNQAPSGDLLAQIDAPNYLSFLGTPSLYCSTYNNPPSDPTAQCITQYNVVLYPSAAVNQDVVLKVIDDKGNPVTTGTVVATRYDSSSFGVGLGNLLGGDYSTRPSTVTATVDSTGSATLPKAQLMLGAPYEITVYGAQSSQGPLMASYAADFTAGVDFNEITIVLTPGAQSPIAQSVNNDPALGNVQRGNLQVTFTFPVEICSDPGVVEGFTVTYEANANGDGILATPAATTPVTVTPDTQGYNLTLTPNFEPGTLQTGAGGDGNIRIAFDNNLRVKPKGSSDAGCTYLFDVWVRDDAFRVPSSIWIQYQ